MTNALIKHCDFTSCNSKAADLQSLKVATLYNMIASEINYTLSKNVITKTKATNLCNTL